VAELAAVHAPHGLVERVDDAAAGGRERCHDDAPVAGRASAPPGRTGRRPPNDALQPTGPGAHRG
jgi:hypothetical protein